MEGRAPRDVLAPLLIFFWKGLSMLLWPLQVTSEQYMSVELKMASCRCRTEIGGTPCPDTMDRSLFSAALAQLALFDMLSET